MASAAGIEPGRRSQESAGKKVAAHGLPHFFAEHVCWDLHMRPRRIQPTFGTAKENKIVAGNR